MAYNQPSIPERPIVVDSPRAPEAYQTPEHQVYANQDPRKSKPNPKRRPETQQGLLSPTGFGHPLPLGNASFLMSDNRQNFRCHIGGCCEIRPHEHKDDGMFFQSSQEPLEEGGFRTFLDSINNNNAEFSRQASQIDNAVLPPAKHENSHDLPSAPGMPPSQRLNEDNNSRDRFSAQVE